MASLRELISELYLEITPHVSDDTVLDDRLIAHWIHKQRALWIRNELNKSHRSVDSGITQTMIMNLELVTDNELDTLGVPEGYTLYKTEETFPNTIELHNSIPIVHVGPVYDSLVTDLDRTRYTRPFKLIDFTGSSFVGYGKFSKGKSFAYPMDNKIYVFKHIADSYYDALDKIKIVGVFENPSEVPGFDEDDRYPMSMYMWNYIKGTIIREDLKSFYVPIIDDVNNASNDIRRGGNEESS